VAGFSKELPFRGASPLAAKAAVGFVVFAAGLKAAPFQNVGVRWTKGDHDYDLDSNHSDGRGG
jgi:hypothetical protein